MIDPRFTSTAPVETLAVTRPPAQPSVGGGTLLLSNKPDKSAFYLHPIWHLDRICEMQDAKASEHAQKICRINVDGVLRFSTTSDAKLSITIKPPGRKA